MIGTSVDHYRIVSKIGEGGMGIVYRAHDEVLNRDVALKVLTKDSLNKLGRDHLLSEARTASSLSHPNICTIHEIRKSGEEFYVVMELIDGRPLRAMITDSGLPNETVLRY